jgi:AcrR family transcriptional regulator
MAAADRTAEPARTAAAKPAANRRELLLDAAYRLFCRDGVQAVGIARIIEEAGVSKMTLYHHFQTKEDLVLAVLERREEVWTQWVIDETLRRGATARDQLLAIFDVLDEWFQRDDYEACLFIRCLLEVRDRSSPIGQASISHIDTVRAFLRELCLGAGVRDADELAHQWQILMRGAICAAAEGHLDAAERARAIAEVLLRSGPAMRRPGSAAA